MGENIKLKRVGKDQTRVMSLRGYNLLSERDRKKWEVISGEVEEPTTKKKMVHVAGAEVKGMQIDEVNVPASKPFQELPVSEPEIEQEESGLAELQTEYKNLTGKDPKGNWKAKRLSEEIQKAKDGNEAE